MIEYVIGDATHPIGEGPKLIAHVCNDYGGWGAGFVLALSKRWRKPERQYRALAAGLLAEDDEAVFALGYNQYVPVEQYICVVNMIAQRGNSRPGQPAIDYAALSRCLRDLAWTADELGASIHMPRIGCGLGGGDWNEVEWLLDYHLSYYPVYVYDLPQ